MILWFKSFITDRCQKIKIGEYESIEITIMFGVPQGSVLGHVLFNIYIRSLYNTVTSKKFNIHGFADDHQVYKSFNHQQEYDIMVNELPSCFTQINQWMSQHFLQLNPGKTELIVFGNQSILSKLQIQGVFINASICIRLVSTAKNLGFRLDSQLNLSDQIQALKLSCYHKLRNISKMKYYLSTEQMQILVQSLVISSLDYCNGLYYGINSKQLKQLQCIQNRACKTILGLKRKDHVSNHLKELHWLRIQERIEFKIILLTYKALNGLSPSYISELLQYNNISGSRSPSLKTYIAKSSMGSRANTSVAPCLWNALPDEIKHVDNISVFKKLLKSYLFRKSYY